MKELTINEFIAKTVEEIEAGLPQGYILNDSIDFEISVATRESTNGGVDVKIVVGKLSNENEIVQKINFSIINSAQKDKEMRKSGDMVIKYINKGVKELSKINQAQKTLENNQ
jgi:hypothetical protein